MYLFWTLFNRASDRFRRRHSFFSSPGSRFKFFKWSGSFALLKCPPSPFGLTSAFTRDVGGDLEL